MIGSIPLDIFATKGLEYLVVIISLGLLALYWQLLRRSGPVAQTVSASPTQGRLSGWFAVPEGLFFHPGHSWAMASSEDVLSIGVDDFAQKLLGRVDGLRLPAPGERVEQGDAAFQVEADGELFGFLSPVDGEVLECNAQALEQPDLVNSEPYDRGWLLKVRPFRARSNLRTLLSGDAARRWMDGVEDGLRERMTGSLGTVLADGGEVVSGIAKAMEEDRWADVAREFLLEE